MDRINLDPDGTYWCEECETYAHENDPCDCEDFIDLDADPQWLRRLNPDVDIPEEDKDDR